MAIRNADGSIILTTEVDQSGLSKGLGTIKKLGASVGKTVLAIGAAAATATVAITKMAVSAYADYEQLVGGVETLFKGSSKKIMDYANDAFYTAGVSANEYMKQVTSFSASLIRSTAGDTDKAADIANMALIDISDNVNKMGSSMESVTLAYQGFAKQQYMLLDNLKLGYGGTKTEMQRLLKDAQALTGVKYDINNLADVYSAIHAIQEELGITGTTAKEAEKTITGSANMMKAAWQNVLSAIAGGGDLDRAINNLVYSIQKYFENIVPVVQRSLIGIGQLIEKVAPMLVQNVASALIQAIPSLVNAIFQMVVGLAKGIYEGIKALFTGGSGSITAEVKTGVDSVSSSIGDATTGMEGLGDATEEAGKKAKKSLAAFDDLQILANNAETASAGIQDSSSGIGSTGLGEVATEMTVVSKDETQVTFLDTIKKTLQEISDIFMSGFWKGFEGADFSGISGNISGIAKNLQELASDPDIKKAGTSLGKTYIEAFGSAVGNVASIGVSIAENVSGGVEQYLDENKDELKQKTLSIFGNNDDMVSKGTELGNTLTSVISTTISGENGQALTASVLGLFSTVVLEITDLFSKLGADAVSLIADPIIENKDELQKALDGLTEIVSKFVDTVKDLLKSIFTSVQTLYDEKIKPFIDTITKTFSELVNQILDAWNNQLKPVFDELIDKLQELVDDYLAPMFSGIGEFVGVLIDNVIMPLWEHILKPLLIWLTNEFFAGNTKGFGQLGDAISFFGQVISGVISGILQVLSGLIEFIAGVFTGDWEKAWHGILNILYGIINLIITGIEGLLNGVINAINGILRGIYGVINTAGNIFGQGNKWDLSKYTIPTVNLSSWKLTIPALATGAVLPPNKPFVAVVGDQKNGTYIEAPAKLIKQMAKEAIAESGFNGQATKEEHYYLNETQLMSIVYKLFKGGERLNGNSLIGGAY